MKIALTLLLGFIAITSTQANPEQTLTEVKEAVRPEYLADYSYAYGAKNNLFAFNPETGAKEKIATIKNIEKFVVSRPHRGYVYTQGQKLYIKADDAKPKQLSNNKKEGGVVEFALSPDHKYLAYISSQISYKAFTYGERDYPGYTLGTGLYVMDLTTMKKQRVAFVKKPYQKYSFDTETDSGDYFQRFNLYIHGITYSEATNEFMFLKQHLYGFNPDTNKLTFHTEVDEDIKSFCPLHSVEYTAGMLIAETLVCWEGSYSFHFRPKPNGKYAEFFPNMNEARKAGVRNKYGRPYTYSYDSDLRIGVTGNGILLIGWFYDGNLDSQERRFGIYTYNTRDKRSGKELFQLATDTFADFDDNDYVQTPIIAGSNLYLVGFANGQKMHIQRVSLQNGGLSSIAKVNIAPPKTGGYRSTYRTHWQKIGDYMLVPMIAKSQTKLFSIDLKAQKAKTIARVDVDNTQYPPNLSIHSMQVIGRYFIARTYGPPRQLLPDDGK